MSLSGLNPADQRCQSHEWRVGSYIYRVFEGGWKWRHVDAPPDAWVYGSERDAGVIAAEFLRTVAQLREARRVIDAECEQKYRLISENLHLQGKLQVARGLFEEGAQ